MRGNSKIHSEKTTCINHGQIYTYRSKGLEDIFKRIIIENFPELGKEMPIQIQEALGHQAED